MIRGRLRSVARKVALRAFGMEWEAEELAPNEGNTRRAAPTSIDPSLIPRVVDGSGDTPGPNHKEDIGRTWLAAQVSSGVAPVLFDLRTPKECAVGVLPGARVVPGDLLRSRLALLPGKDVRVTVYDQVGSDAATAMAAWLRDQGWTMARRLKGGFAEWIEHGEPTATPQPAPDGPWHVGSPVELRDGRRGWVMSVTASGGAATYEIWFDDGSTVGPLGADALRA